MSIFYEFGSWVMGGLRRMAGVQYSYPTYTEEAASPVTFDSAMQLSAVWALLVVHYSAASCLAATRSLRL